MSDFHRRWRERDRQASCKRCVSNPRTPQWTAYRDTVLGQNVSVHGEQFNTDIARLDKSPNVAANRNLLVYSLNMNISVITASGGQQFDSSQIGISKIRSDGTASSNAKDRTNHECGAKASSRHLWFLSHLIPMESSIHYCNTSAPTFFSSTVNFKSMHNSASAGMDIGATKQSCGSSLVVVYLSIKKLSLSTKPLRNEIAVDQSRTCQSGHGSIQTTPQLNTCAFPKRSGLEVERSQCFLAA